MKPCGLNMLLHGMSVRLVGLVPLAGVIKLASLMTFLFERLLSTWCACPASEKVSCHLARGYGNAFDKVTEQGMDCVMFMEAAMRDTQKQSLSGQPLAQPLARQD